MKVERLRLISGRYFWRPTAAVKALGFSAEALGEDLAKAITRAQQLNAEVAAARGEAPAPQSGPRSIAALIREYRGYPGKPETASPEWNKLAPKTQQGYGSILDEIERVAGHGAVTKVTRVGLKTIYRKLMKRGLAIAAAHMRVWRILLGHACDIGWLEINPASALKLITPPPRRQVWSREDITRFVETASALDRLSVGLAVLLAHDLGQREEDIVRLNRRAWDGEAFDLTQGKTGKRVRAPICDPDLAACLTMLEWMGGNKTTQIIVSEATGRPYRMDHFRHEFARIRAAAGISTQLQFRDLRRTALTELGNAGATDDQLRSLSGHMDRKTVSIYVVPSGEMAAAGQAKRLQNRNKTRDQVAKQ